MKHLPIPRFVSGGDVLAARLRTAQRFRTQAGQSIVFADGGLYARYYSTVDGKRVKVSSLLAAKGDFDPTDELATKRLLAAKMDAVNVLQRGEYDIPAVNELTIGEVFADAYIPAMRAGESSWSTLRTYSRMWARYCAELVGDKPLRSFGPADAADFLKALAKRKLKSGAVGLNRNSINMCRAVVRNVFVYAISENLYTGANPFDGLKVFGVKIRPHGKRVAYTFEEVSAVLDRIPARDTAARLLWMLVCMFSLRPGEAAGCRWEDIDGDSILHVQRSCPSGHEQESVKTDASVRFEYLATSPTVLELLAKHRARSSGTGYLFKTRTGKPIDSNMFARRRIKKYAESTMGERYRGLYAGRRGAVTAHRIATGNSNSGSKTAGHANTRTTDAVYTELPDSVALAGQQIVAAAFEKIRS